MKFSRMFVKIERDVPSEAEVISHKLMLRAGMIKKVASGIFSYLPLGYRVIKKIETIIREEMNRAGAQELLMPMLQPAELWIESGRWQKMGKELARLKDRNERDFCLGPTHEEVITDIARNFLQSYKQLPVHLYQIQTKFRDETRPRFGLMRGREFLMKDGYSFHESLEDALKEYQNMFQTYQRIFQRCGLDFRAVEAETGDIGGSQSHEFHVLAQSGEDEVLSCDQCQYTANASLIQKKSPEKSPEKSNDMCLKCHQGKFKSYRGIEVGHIFCLGDKYSKAMSATFLNKEGKQKYFEMGCYGIGVGRTAAAAIEQNHDPDGIIWPISIAPFQVAVIPIQGADLKITQEAERISQALESQGVEVLYYDKEESAGVKFKDIDLLGIPLRVTVGSKGLSQQKIGLKLRQEKEEKLISLSQALPEIMKVQGELFKKTNHRS